jgi:gliding motility-associated-like protein
VALKPSPTVKITADKTSVPPGQSVQLTASGADTYLWAPAETLDNAAIASPKASPTVNTTYTVKGTAGGCAGQDSIDIIVSGDLLTIKVTNIFTPNGDGHNDVWAIPGIDYYQDCTLSLFDKNGSKVFEQKGYKSDWDGTYKGQNAPEGTYYYVLVCPDKKPLTGNVLLAR